jgi:hypothetical protein
LKNIVKRTTCGRQLNQLGENHRHLAFPGVFIMHTLFLKIIPDMKGTLMYDFFELQRRLIEAVHPQIETERRAIEAIAAAYASGTTRDRRPAPPIRSPIWN